MRPFRAIRERLSLTQAQMATALGCSQGNVSFYERGQVVPPSVARRLIDLARERGVALSYEHLYDGVGLPPAAAAASKAA